MKIKALRNLITKKYGNITKGAVIEVTDELGKAWVKCGAGEQVEEPKVEKPKAPAKEKAVKEMKTEKAVK